MQGGQAQAELQSLEAAAGGSLTALPTRAQEALREQLPHWSEALQRASAAVGHAINDTMHRCCCHNRQAMVSSAGPAWFPNMMVLSFSRMRRARVPS